MSNCPSFLCKWCNHGDTMKASLLDC